MTCPHRKYCPIEVASMMLSLLVATSTERSETHPEYTKISVAVQTDDPKCPGKLKLDIDYPTSPGTAIQNHLLCRLEIDAETGAMKFFPDGYNTDGRAYRLIDAPTILYRMNETIRLSVV